MRKLQRLIAVGIVALASCVSSVPDPAALDDPRDHNAPMTTIKEQP